MRTMKAICWVLGSLALVSACSDDDTGRTGNTGGGGGISGLGGASGKGGTSGSAGKSGAAGTSGGGGISGGAGASGASGESGSAGSAGSGGGAGQDGGAGAAGSGGEAGSAGSAGSGGTSGSAGADAGDATPPNVSSTLPSNGASGIAKKPLIVVTFDEPMNPATLTATTSGTACSGSVQVSGDDFATCVTMAGAPVASNANKSFSVQPAGDLASLGSYKIRVTTAAADAAGNSLAAAYTSATGFVVRYFHTIVIDGTNDFAQNETFSTSSAGYTAYVAWDDAYLYLGMKGVDVASGSATKWLVAYLGGAGGGTTGELYLTQQPGLPFASKWHLRWKADNSYTNARTWSGSFWIDAGWDFTGDVIQSSDFVELRAALSDLGSPTTLALVVGMLNEQSGVEGSYAALPASAYTDGYDPNFAKYLQLALTASTPPTGSSVLP